MKILIVGPSPYMQHDPGLTVREFIENYCSELDITGCFYHHDFGKIPIKYDSDFTFNDLSIKSKWVNPSERDGSVILLYDMLMEEKYDMILSFCTPLELDFIRAAIGTSAVICPWIHVMTMSNGIHDLKMVDALNAPDYIFSYSEYQINSINKIAGVPLHKMEILERNFNFPEYKGNKVLGAVCGGWNSESYNLKSVFQTLEDFDISIKCLSNYFELGDFDLDLLSSQHLYNHKKNDLFCEDFSSVFVKPEYSKWDYYIDSMSIFIDMSMQQGSCRSLHRAYSSGSTCFAIDTPRHREFAPVSDRFILVNSNTFFSASGCRLYVPDHLDFYVKLSKKLEGSYSVTCNTKLNEKKHINIKKDFNNLYCKITNGIKERIFSDFESIT